MTGPTPDTPHERDQKADDLLAEKDETAANLQVTLLRMRRESRLFYGVVLAYLVLEKVV